MGDRDGNGFGASNGYGAHINQRGIIINKGCGINGHYSGNGQSFSQGFYATSGSSGGRANTGDGYSYDRYWPQVGSGDVD